MRTRRRGAGEGLIHERLDGRWEARIDLGWNNGRRVRKSFYGETRAEVSEALTKALYDRQQGLPVVDERQTVRQFLTHWLDHSVKGSVRPRTYQSYELLVRLHILPTLEKVRIASLTPQHVQALLDRKRKEGLAPQTVRHVRTVLRRALNQAVRFELLKRNVAALVETPKVERHEIRPLAPEEARRLLDAARDGRLEALYSVALALGLRRGEILGLRWQDVDLETRTLQVRQAIQRISQKLGEAERTGLHAAEPKTDRSRRNIAVPESVARALRAHRVRQLEERLLAGSRWRESGLVFTSTIGTPLEPRNLHRDFKRTLTMAGLPDARFHDLRHSAASLLIAQGIPLRTIMELLGHSSISVTADIYAHIGPAVMRDVADKMEAILGSR